MARRKTRKKAWKDFEITKVKLNPEQAVLACCDTSRVLTDAGLACNFFCPGLGVAVTIT